jgi:hypothetical protein
VADVRLLRSNLRKLRTRPATWVTFLLLVGLYALVLFSVVLASRLTTDPMAGLAARQYLTFPAAYELTLALLLGVGGLLAVAYGAAIAGSEWAWGTIKAAVARGEGRAQLTLLGFAGVAVYTWLGMLGAFLAGVAMTALGALLSGVDVSGLADGEALLRLPELFARAGLALAMNAALGFAIATVTRSQLAGIVLAIGLYFAEGIAGIFAPHVFKWFPFTASGAVVGGGDGGSVVVNGAEVGATLDTTTAIAVTVLWLAAALAIAVVRTERAEITG